MKILLCGPIQEDAEIQNWGAPCLGIIRITEYLRNTLKDASLDILLYDPQIDHFDPIEKYKQEAIDILGVSLLHYTLFDTFIFLSKFRKDHPNTLIVVGGNEAGANYQDVFEKSSADIAVTAEGEDTFCKIVLWRLGKAKLEDIDGIIYRKYAKPITSEKLWDYWKFVDFSRYRYQEYWDQIASLYKTPDYEKINYVRLMTVSHCQRKCTFCSLPMVRNLACGEVVCPASLTGPQIMNLVNKVYTQLPKVRTLYFCTDDVFYPNKKNFLDFMDLYKQSGYDYRILIQTSTYSLRREYFVKLREINCQHITIGFENCSESIRASLCKPQKQDKMEDIIRWGKEYGIQIYVLIILMPPKTTLQDLKINYETLSRWVEYGVQISVEPVMYPYRGAPIFNMDGHIHYETRESGEIAYRDAKWMLPEDSRTRKLCEALLEQRDEYVENYLKNSGSEHRHKGSTGVAIASLLGKLLKEVDPTYTYKGL